MKDLCLFAVHLPRNQVGGSTPIIGCRGSIPNVIGTRQFFAHFLDFTLQDLDVFSYNNVIGFLFGIQDCSRLFTHGCTVGGGFIAQGAAQQ